MPDNLKVELQRILSRHVGRGNPITAGVLAEMFGYEDDRPIRKAIEELIDDNFPICSVTEEPAGYFYFPPALRRQGLTASS